VALGPWLHACKLDIGLEQSFIQIAAKGFFEPSFDNAAPYANVSLQPIKKSSLT
jgi:hypothetical protein